MKNKEKNIKDMIADGIAQPVANTYGHLFKEGYHFTVETIGPNQRYSMEKFSHYKQAKETFNSKTATEVILELRNGEEDIQLAYRGICDECKGVGCNLCVEDEE